MRKRFFRDLGPAVPVLVVLAVLAVVLIFAGTVHSQAPALDDLGTALTNHGMDQTTAGAAAAVIEVAISNNNALITRLQGDETNISGVQASITALQPFLQNQINSVGAAETADASNIQALSGSFNNLQTSVTSVQTAETTDAQNIQGLQGQVATLQPSTISALQAQVAQLQTQLAAVQATAPTTPVSFLQQPTNLTVSAGSNAVFTMKLSSGGCRTQVIMNPGPNGFGSVGDNTGTYTYTVNSVTSALNGKTYQFDVYGCTQPGSVNSNTVTLTVQ